MNVLKLVKAMVTKPSRYTTAICVACLLLAVGIVLIKKTFTTNGVTYKILTGSTVQVTAVLETLKAVEIPSTVTRFKTTYTVTDIGLCAFWNRDSLTSVTLPMSLISIGESAFGHCENLTSVTLPDSMTSIGYRAFSECSALTSVTIPDSVTSIGVGAFSGCYGLTSVTIPDSVTSIGSSAFSGCSDLTSVTLPASVKNIGDSAFAECGRLNSISVLGIKEPTVDDEAFDNGPPKRILYVPNATGGFNAKKWGAASVVYGTAAK